MIEETTLFKKIYGCIAGGNIGASMGEPARRYGGGVFDPYRGLCGPHEGAHYKEIEKAFGEINTLQGRTLKEKRFRWHNGPMFYYPACEYPPGMTEDGVERKFLVIKAIVDRGGRITADDLQASWLKYVKPEKLGYLLLPRDKMTYENMKRFPAREVGKYDRWPGNVDVLMMIHPVGIINAGNPKQAVWDALDVSSCIQSPLISYAPASAAAIAGAIAEAFKPGATVDSMIDAAIRYIDENVRDVILEAIDIAKQYPDPKEVRDPFYAKFGGRVPTDSLEVVSESFALFYIVKGDPVEGMIAGTNFGRDADCLASIVAAMGGALYGIDRIPKEMIETVDNAVLNFPHTIIDCPMREQAMALCNALMNNLQGIEAQARAVRELM